MIMGMEKNMDNTTDDNKSNGIYDINDEVNSPDLWSYGVLESQPF